MTNSELADLVCSGVRPLTISVSKAGIFLTVGGRSEAENRANAAFIVKAVNSHDHLVTALVEILEKAESEDWTLPSSFAARARTALNGFVGSPTGKVT